MMRSVSGFSQKLKPLAPISEKESVFGITIDYSLIFLQFFYGNFLEFLVIFGENNCDLHPCPRPSSKVDRSVELQCTLVKGVRLKPKKQGTAGVCWYVSSILQNTVDGKKSCTTWDVQNLVNNGIFTVSTGAGFLPSTVAQKYSDIRSSLPSRNKNQSYCQKHWYLNETLIMPYHTDHTPSIPISFTSCCIGFVEH